MRLLEAFVGQVVLIFMLLPVAIILGAYLIYIVYCIIKEIKKW